MDALIVINFNVEDGKKVNGVHERKGEKEPRIGTIRGARGKIM